MVGNNLETRVIEMYDLSSIATEPRYNPAKDDSKVMLTPFKYFNILLVLTVVEFMIFKRFSYCWNNFNQSTIERTPLAASSKANPLSSNLV